jgi:hypothetical protein
LMKVSGTIIYPMLNEQASLSHQCQIADHAHLLQ